MFISKLYNIFTRRKKEKLAATIITGDNYSRSSFFWENDIEKWEGRIVSNFLVSNNLEELINEPTYIRDDGTQSCIDLSTLP